MPDLHGYLREKGLTTDKMMRIINAFYKASTEKYGKEIISEDVFKARKRMIVEAWRAETDII